MYWLCFSPCFVHKRNNYHSWIFSLVSNSGCGVIDSNFDLQPISQSGLIIFSHYPVLFSAEIGFCIVGCSFHMVLMCTCTWITAETFQTWRDKGGDFAAGASPGAAPLCVHVAESRSAPEDQAANCISSWLQDTQHQPGAHYCSCLPPWLSSSH